jgi:hypothetical protein
LARHDENACADNGADAKADEIERTQCPLQFAGMKFSLNIRDWFSSE